ncbi:phage tail tape measure protein [Streptomyces roseolus]|uniref:phage tail tape measure protein n=1 Tax=Streptomyces roseolus TaxID=67358 RepID=UPI0036CC1674
MAEEVGVAYVRLVPSMRGFAPAAADAMNEAAAGPAEQAGDQAGSSFGEAFKGALLGVAVVAGAALVLGVGKALEEGQIKAKMNAQLGATGAEAEKYGKVAGSLYAKGITTDFQQAADAIRATMSAGLAPPDATNQQLEQVSTKVADVANTFDLELGEAATAVGQLIKNGMAKDANEGLDLITRGLQGADMRGDDLLETVTEYGSIFKGVGITGATAMGLINQGLDAGVVNTDKIADAVKEFSLRAVAQTEGIATAFEDLGLNGKKVGEDIAAGGKRGEDAFGLVLEKIQALPASARRAEIIQELFGGPGEDLGAGFFALNVDKARQGMDGAAGSAGKLGDQLRGNAGAQLTAFTRGIEHAFVDVVGGKIIPVIMDFIGWMKENRATVEFLAGVLTGILVPALLLMAAHAVTTAATTVTAWVTSGAAALTAAGTHISAAATTVGAWLSMAAGAVAHAATVALAWTGAALRAIGNFALAVARAAVAVVAQMAMMAARAVVWAATMAAQWLIAMGPIGWAIAAVAGLVALVIAYWDEIKAATKAAWDWVAKTVVDAGKAVVQWFTSWTIWSTISRHWQKTKDGTRQVWNDLTGWLRQLPGRVVGYFASWNIASVVSQHWRRAKEGAVEQARALLDWMRKLPGEIGKALGSLGNLLVSAGKDVVRGLWNGIKSMGGWLKSTLIGWARTIIPGPIADALGIKSPSRVMADEVGRWIPPGIVMGVEDELPELASATRTAVTSAVPAAAGAASRPAAAAGTTVVIDGSAMPSALWEWLKNSIRIEGGGSVQTALGYNPTGA